MCATDSVDKRVEKHSKLANYVGKVCQALDLNAKMFVFLSFLLLFRLFCGQHKYKKEAVENAKKKKVSLKLIHTNDLRVSQQFRLDCW